MTARQGAADPAVILDEAADWLVVLNEDSVSTADRQAWQAWRARSAEHERAWQRAEQLMAKLGGMPAALAMPALDRPARAGRRAALAKLAAALLVVPASIAAWRLAAHPGGTADYRSATGERRDFQLADGTRITLNTGSAIDVRYDALQRDILLRDGEILIQTAPDTAATPRGFRVLTRDGTLEALGTRFTVRQQQDQTHLAVLEGAVRLTPRQGGADAIKVLQAGEQTHFSMTRADAPAALDPAATAWIQGMLLADNLRLADVARELARYRHGVVRCDPAVADLRVSGSFPVSDTDRAFSMLAATYPVALASRLGGYWVTLGPR